MKKHIFLGFALLLCLALPVQAQHAVKVLGADGETPAAGNNGIAVTPTSNSAANSTQLNGTIQSTAFTINFTATSTQFTIATAPGSPTLYVSYNGNTATTGTNNLIVFPGGTVTVAGILLDSVSAIGSSTGGTWTLSAH